MTAALPMGMIDLDKQGSEPTAVEIVADLRAMAARSDWAGFTEWLVENFHEEDCKHVAREVLRKALTTAGDEMASTIVATLSPESLLALRLTMVNVRSYAEALMRSADLDALSDLLDQTAILAPDDPAIAGLQVRLLGRLLKGSAIRRLINERPAAFTHPLALLNASDFVQLKSHARNRLIEFMEDTPTDTPPQLRIRGVRWLFLIGEEERAERIARRFMGNEGDGPFSGIVRLMQRAPNRPSRLKPSETYPEIMIGHSRDDRGAAIFFGGLGERALNGGHIFDRYLAGLGLTMIMAQDPCQLMFLDGIPGVTDSMEQAVAALRTLVSGLGIKRLYTVGSSAGGFPAVVYGLQLKAEAALLFGSPTVCGKNNSAVETRATVSARRLQSRFDDRTLDMNFWLDESEHDMPITLYHAADNSIDAWHARQIADRTNVIVYPIPGTSSHQGMIEASRDRHLGKIFREAFALPPLR